MRVFPVGGIAQKSRFFEPPIFLFEGDERKILIWRGAFLELFTSDGKYIARLGRKGEGPGEFSAIIKAIFRNDKYYILDLPNKISLFDKNFGFVRRIFLSGKYNSPIIQDFSVDNNTIVAIQRDRIHRGKNKKSPIRDNVITLYSRQGEYINSVFSQRNGWSYFPKESLLGGKVQIVDNKYVFSFQSINKIWLVSPEGRIIKQKQFGKNWWKSIHYNDKEFQKAKKTGKPTASLLEEILLSGDQISGLFYYKEHVILKIIRNEDGFAATFLFIFDKNLENETGPLTLENYYFSNVGRDDLYFCRYIDEYSPKYGNTIEILKCDVEYY